MKSLFPFSIFLALAAVAHGQASPPADPPAGNSTDTEEPVIKLENFVVSEHLDQARETIMPSLGASTFTVDAAQIAIEPLGANAPFSQVILRAPGVAQDSEANGDLHVRGEHGNLQYRINNVLLPEGITGFGLELDPRFVGSMQLITGALPAQYGFRTAGVVDIKTKSGLFDSGSEAELYGGSYDTVRTSFEQSGSTRNVNYFVDGSITHNDIGIENPTASATPLHDATTQYKAFGYVSYVLDPSSRLSFMASASSSAFQVPDTPGLSAGTSPDGTPWVPGAFDSSRLDERQNEQNTYGVAAYEKTLGDLNFQVAGYGRFSSAHFIPDVTGDLYFNGVATDIDRQVAAAGIQADGGDILNDHHTVRAGVMLLGENLTTHAATTVFPVDTHGDATGPAFVIRQNGRQHADFYGAYLQDEWKVSRKVTVNYGARADGYSSSTDQEGQISPRVSVLIEPTKSTSIHAGYSRYFTPPPLENVSATAVAVFAGTSNAAPTLQDDPVRAERADYFDIGLTQKLHHGLQVGIDTYYKTAKDQLDDGLFGQSLIQSAFNYRDGRVYGVELSSSYTSGGFTAYANVARSIAQGRDWISAQFLFDPADLAYVKNHWIYLDHAQQLSGSFGAAYSWKHRQQRTQVYVDLLYGSGLRNDAVDSSGNVIPNGGSVPAYHTLSTGVEQKFELSDHRELKARLDIVNLTDEKYELRDGSGVGVNAAQYGMRRGIFGSLGIAF
ncbi:MAG TPA: TonB-dependent receptor [Candidatus Didemnitutus sp.]|nr:TonB-dependent receptor [Candidatus Didemnitutus sp.]